MLKKRLKLDKQNKQKDSCSWLSSGFCGVVDAGVTGRTNIMSNGINNFNLTNEKKNKETECSGFGRFGFDFWLS